MAACEATVDALRPFVRSSFVAGRWPGTISRDEPAAVFWLRLSRAYVEALSTLVEGLYDWQTGSGNPEDLALREDGREFLVSVAHEGDPGCGSPSRSAASLTGGRRTSIHSSEERALAAAVFTKYA